MPIPRYAPDRASVTTAPLPGWRWSAFLLRLFFPWVLTFALVFQGAVAGAHAHGLGVHLGPVSSAHSVAAPAKGGGPAMPADKECDCPICHVLQSGAAFVAAAAPVLSMFALPASPIATVVETRLSNHRDFPAQPRAPPLPR